MAILNNLIVNGAARFLNKTYFDTISADKIDANEGIFKKLVAKNSTLTDVTVVGLLDVTGELHTKSFTNSNIATIDGSFYITPTLGLQGANTTTNTVTVTANSLSFANASGTSFSFESLYLENTTSPVAWSTGSSVIVTGEIQDKTTGEWIPLGTLKGTLSTYSTTSVVINSIKDSANGTAPATLAAIVASGTTSGLKYRNIKVSLVSINRSGLKPLGIFMTATGSNGRTFLDIYGGNNGEVNTYGGLSTPVLRIGNLNGLPALTLPNNTSVAPAGWGIYTTNGFFSGTIVSTQGKIGNFTLGTAIYGATSGSGPSTISATTAGTYLGTDGFRNNNSSDTTKYAQITNGILTAQGAIINGTLSAGAGSTIGPWTVSSDAIYNPSTKSSLSSDTIDGVYLGKDGIALGKNIFKVTNAGVLTAKSGTIGGINIGATYLTTNVSRTTYDGTATGLTITSTGIGAGNGSTNTFKVVASTGVMTATGANLLTATIGNATKKITIGTGTSGHSSICYGMTTLADTTNNGFYIGTDGIALGKGVFKVTDAGVLTATSGTIGGISMNSSYGLYTNSKTSATSTNTGFLISKDGGIYLGAYDSSSGVVSCPFQVTSAGVLTARSGRIGKFNLTNTYLSTGSGSTMAGMGGNQAFWAGNSSSDSAPFRVSYAGVLNATGATLTNLTIKDTTGIRVKVDTNGLTVYDGSGTADANIQAKFGSTVQVGKKAVGYTTISSSGMDIYAGNSNVNLSHFGYDSGTDSEGGTSIAPYYTLGTRKSNSAIGNFSIAEGLDATASGYISHAEGLATEATGYYSHAEGVSTLAEGETSHAEGSGTWAKGDWSHAEGGSSHAKGEYSHAGGYGCKAESNGSFAMGYKVTAYGPYQTAIGKYNKTDTSKAFIIGKGTSETALSNALTVDWNGNVDIASGAKYKINGTNLAASDVGAVPTSRTVNSKALSSDITLTASDVSALPLSGGTLTGRLTLNTFNTAQVNMRPSHASYDGIMSYQTAGNEAWVFSTKNVVTSFMFVNGEDTVSNASDSRWKSLTPGLQIKNNCVSIGKLIGDGVTPSYKLDVNGTVNFTGLGTNAISNIANMFVVEQYSFSAPAISSGSSSDITVTGTKSGYHPLSISGFQTGRANTYFAKLVMAQSDESFTISGTLRANAAVTAGTGYVYVLWVKHS